jgi:hypothetical protein
MAALFFIFVKTKQMCIESLVGLRDCEGFEPSTGLYIDDLGINTTFLGQLITDQYNNGAELFADKRAFAWRKLSSDVLTKLSPMMKSDTVIEGRRIGQAVSNYLNMQTALGAGNYAGIRLKIDPNTISYLNFYLADINIAITSNNMNVPIYIFDMTTGKLLDSFIYFEGSIDQYVGKTFTSARRKMDIAIVYESTMNAVKFTPKKGTCTSCGGGPKESHICPFVDAIGIELTTDGTSVVTSKSSKYTAGMSVNYSVSCDRQGWICSIGGTMALSLAYATAVEIYNYALTVSPNQRVNTTVIVNRGSKPFATADAFEGIVAARDIAASRYAEELGAMLQNMRLPDDTHCWDCRKNMKYVTALP